MPQSLHMTTKGAHVSTMAKGPTVKPPPLMSQLAHLNLPASVLKSSSTTIGPWVGMGVGTAVFVGLTVGVGGMAVAMGALVGGTAAGAWVGSLLKAILQPRVRIMQTASQSKRVDFEPFIFFLLKKCPGG
jgi:hypothetical protein